jgi:uncharacterized protein (DUF983 family)
MVTKNSIYRPIKFFCPECRGTKQQKGIVFPDGSRTCGNCGNEWSPGRYGESKVILNKGDDERNRKWVNNIWKKSKKEK